MMNQFIYSSGISAINKLSSTNLTTNIMSVWENPQLRKFIDYINDKVASSTPESILLYLFDVIFSPNLMIRNLILIGMLQVSITSSLLIGNFCSNFFLGLTKRGKLLKSLKKKLRNVKSYDEWVVTAEKLDQHLGYDKWRKEDSSDFYNTKEIKRRIMDTVNMMKNKDVFHLMFRLRGGLARDQFGIQHVGLFERAFSGTKHLVDLYHDTMSRALEFICESNTPDIPSDAKLAFFNETRHAFGRTALLLSGGAYLGYYHMGVARTLFRQKLLPRVISGSSAGSLMAACIGTRTDEEFAETLNDDQKLLAYRYLFFKTSTEIQSKTGKWILYHSPKWLHCILNPLFSLIFDKKIVNLDTEYFKKVVMDLAGTYTFQEAFDRTGKIINITVAPQNDYDPPRLLNYLTAPHVCVWSAACASCAVPGIFDPINLVVKEPNGNFSDESVWTRNNTSEFDAYMPLNYSDGSIENDLPMKQLSELFNVSHFIVSQVNPHSSMLSSLAIHASVWSPPIYGAIVSYFNFLRSQCRDWVKNVTQLLVSRSLAPSWSRQGLYKTLSVFITQEYEGRAEDITIFPWKQDISILQAFQSIIKNPTEEEFLHVMKFSETAAWPFVARIRANCGVELTLDRCVQQMRRKIQEENLTGNFNVKQTIDRTPSFYTSRSLINLSGLSVSDPLPNIHLIDPLTLSVPAADVPLSDVSNHLRTNSFGDYGIDTDVGYDFNASTDSRDELSRLSNLHASSMKESTKVKKTTSMAKFYYRENNLSDSALAIS